MVHLATIKWADVKMLMTSNPAFLFSVTQPSIKSTKEMDTKPMKHQCFLSMNFKRDLNSQ